MNIFTLLIATITHFIHFIQHYMWCQNTGVGRTETHLWNPFKLERESKDTDGIISGKDGYCSGASTGGMTVSDPGVHGALRSGWGKQSAV